MARLIIKSGGFNNQVIELKLGLNRFGRSSANDFQIEHATISGTHCQLELVEGQIILRDCNSTNGTLVNGETIQEARLGAGQTFFLGDVEFYIENTDLEISIPEYKPPPPPPPVVLKDGALICPRHPEARVTHQCTFCKEVMCEACVHKLRRKGGKMLRLCPICSHNCEPIGGEKKKKKGFLEILQKTVKLPFIHHQPRQ